MLLPWECTRETLSRASKWAGQHGGNFPCTAPAPGEICFRIAVCMCARLVLKSHATLSSHLWKWWLSISLTTKQSHLRGLFNPKPRHEHMSTRHTPAPTQPKLFALAYLNPYWTASAHECGHEIQWESWTSAIHEDSLPRVLAQSSQKTTLGDEETDWFSNRPVYVQGSSQSVVVIVHRHQLAS